MKQRCPFCSGETGLIYDSYTNSPAGCEICYMGKNPKKYHELKDKQNKEWTLKMMAFAKGMKK